VFLGHEFDHVKEPLFVDGANHLCPLGNEIVARAIVEKFKDPGAKGSRILIQQNGTIALR